MSEIVAVNRPESVEAKTRGLRYVGVMSLGRADSSHYGNEFRLVHEHVSGSWSFFTVHQVLRIDENDKEIYGVCYMNTKVEEMHEDTMVHVFENVMEEARTFTDAVVRYTELAIEWASVDADKHARYLQRAEQCGIEAMSTCEKLHKAHKLKADLLLPKEAVSAIMYNNIRTMTYNAFADENREAIDASLEHAKKLLDALTIKPPVAYDGDTEEFEAVEETVSVYTKAQEIAYLRKCANEAPNDSYLKMLLSPALIEAFDTDVQNDGVPNYYERLRETEQQMVASATEKDQEIARLQRELESLKKSKETQAEIIKRQNEREQKHKTEINRLSNDLHIANTHVNESAVIIQKRDTELTAIKAEKFDHFMKLIDDATHAKVMREWIGTLILEVCVPDEHLDNLPAPFADTVLAAKAKKKLLCMEDKSWEGKYFALKQKYEYIWDKYDEFGTLVETLVVNKKLSGEGMQELSAIVLPADDKENTSPPLKEVLEK